MADKLSPTDRSSLNAERGAVNMAIGAVIVAERGQGLTYDALTTRIEERIHLIPRYRQRLESPIPGITNPVWVDDENFDVRWHVRQATLPPPGDYDALAAYVSREASRLMDRTRPLWEVHLVDGLQGERVALVLKMHHALVDGMAALGVGMILLDAGPVPDPVEPPPRAWRPRPSQLRSHLARMAYSPIDLTTKLALDSVDRVLDASPRSIARDLRRATGLASELARLKPGAPDLPLNYEISANRRYVMTLGELEPIKRVAKSVGGTVNDAILAAVAGMLKEWLKEAGVPRRSTRREPIALVPVSVRREGDDAMGNQISLVFVNMPVNQADPRKRIELIHQRMETIKGSAQVRAGSLLVQMVGLAPPLLSSVLSRADIGGGTFNLVVSNVPGPQFPLYLNGSKVVEAYPMVPLNPDDQALNVGVLSYNGLVCFGLMADRDLDPPVDRAREALDLALRELTAGA